MSFTEEQLAALQAPLAAAHVKEREQAGRRLSYIEAWHAIDEANRIFGFAGWDREMVECRCVTEAACRIAVGARYERDGWRVGYTARVRITVRAGETVIVREGSGYGSGILDEVGAAHESALKEAESDAMKRALMTFGYPFGLALYDRDKTHVEAPQKSAGEPSRPPAPNGAARPSPTQARSADTKAGQFKLSTIRDRIMAEIQTKTTRLEILAYMKLCAPDIELISNAHGPTAMMLRGLFETQLQSVSGEL
jgi:DNA repair and recombination protein RAD52